MADSVVEQITKAICTRLLDVQTTAGYEINIDEVHRPKQTGLGDIEIRDRVATVFLHSVEELELDGDQKNVLQKNFRPVVERTAHYGIVVFRSQSEQSDIPIDKLLSDAAADIEKVLAVDGQFGGLAMSSFVRAWDAFKQSGTEFDGVIVAFDVTYRHLRKNPYSGG